MSKLLILCVILGTICVSQVSAQTPTCMDGFYFDGQKCEICSTNCKTCTALLKCTTCKDNMYLSGDNCMSCGNNDGVKSCCAVGGDSSAIRATECLTGYFLDGSVCLKADPNCMSRIGTTLLCQTCKDGYYIDEHNICVVGAINGCKTYTNKANCNTCSDGFYKEAKNDAGGLLIQTCTACNANCLCSDNKNLCVSCVAGAYESQAAGAAKACTLCTDPTDKVKKRRPLKCDANGCLVNDSSSCPSDSLCLKDGTAECKAIENCDKVATSTAGIKCTVCKTGFYIDTATDGCAKCPDSTDASTDYAKCKSTTDIQQCAQTIWTIPFANARYLVTDTSVTPNIKVCKQNTNNCKTMKDQGQLCTACYDGYQNVDGICKTCASLDSNCVECAVTGAAGAQKLQCTKCKMNQDSTTATNYFPKTDKTACQAYPDKVMSCSTNSDTAAELKGCTCVSGYKITKGTESTCQKCTDDNCKDCGDKNTDGTATCKVCNSGYGVVNSACEKCTENCANCDTNSAICKTCKAGFFIVDKYCSMKRDYCTSYDSSGCSTCAYNYYKNSQHCSLCHSRTNLVTSATSGPYDVVQNTMGCPKVDAKTCAPVVTPPPTPSSGSTTGSTTSGTVTPSDSNVTPTPNPSTASSSNSVILAIASIFSLFLIL